MTDSTKATRADVPIGSLTVNGFMLPDGAYRMSLTQASECVGKTARSIFAFLKLKALKTMLEGSESTFAFLPEAAFEALKDRVYAPDSFVVEIESGKGGETRISGLPLAVVALYWHWESHRGNREAFLLTLSFSIEGLERRFDAAFNINRSEQELQTCVAESVRQLERDLTQLGEAYAIDDEVRSQLAYFERLLREAGIDSGRENQDQGQQVSGIFTIDHHCPSSISLSNVQQHYFC